MPSNGKNFIMNLVVSMGYCIENVDKGVQSGEESPAFPEEVTEAFTVQP